MKNMKYENLKRLNDKEFKRALGVERETFEIQVAVLEEAFKIKHKKGGRPPKLTIEDKLVLMYNYYRDYTTFFKLGIYFELDESSALNYLASLTKKNPKFCYAEYDNKEVLELCTKLKLHTVIPTIKVVDYPYKTIKAKLTNSAIISLPITEQVISQLDLIVDYITQKGYSFLTLEELLSEQVEK